MMNRIRQIFTHSFPLRLSLVILGIAAILLILTSVGNYRSARKYVQRESVERAQSALENTILRINKVLESVEITIHNLSWQVSENIDSPEMLYDITRHIVESNSFISGSAIAFEPYQFEEFGLFFSPYSFREGDQIKSKQLGTKDYDYHYMDWYQIPRLLNQPYWSEPYYDDGGGNMIMTTYSYPIYNARGDLIAIFTADLSLEWFTELVNSIKPYPNSYNLMIGRGGTFLVHNDKEAILNETIFASARSQNKEELIAIAHRMVDGKSGVTELERNGEIFFFVYAPVKTTGWSVAVACLHSDIFSGVEKMRKQSEVVVLAGLILMVMLCFFTIRRMTRPLTEFAHSALDIAQGNFSTKLPAVKGHDEMRTLHDSFSHMQSSLQRYIDELRDTTANKERIESELRIARSIQMSMVPKFFPPFPEREDIDLYACLQPAREVGGDLYDFFIEGEKLYFIIGDVSGKGVPASLVMAVTCRLFRTIATHSGTPERIVSTLNDALSDNNESNMFCTCFVGILDLQSGRLQYCNAGHNPPMLLSPDGSVARLKIVPNLALGVWSGFDYVGESCSLERGSVLFMYTDGVTEAESNDKQLYTEQRLLDLLQGGVRQTPRTITESVLADIAEHAQGAVQSDDITILCCELSHPPKEEDGERIVLHNDIAEIGRMAAFLDELCERFDLPAETAFNIHLALEEAISNVILYAYPEGERHDIVLTARKMEDRLIFKITDTGKPFDPTRQPDADVTLSLEERPIGGLGIFLIRRIMQAVEYRRVGDKNILTMVRVLNSETRES